MKRRPGDGTGPLLDLFLRAGALKNEPRRGWVLKLGKENPESVADHSYRTAIMAMVYADANGMDTARAVKMALIHDLPEALVGDAAPGEIHAREKRSRETAAMKKILADLPAGLRREYLSIWGEFSRGRTREARLVRQVDKLEMALQAAEYRDSGSGAATAEFFETARGAVVDDYLRGMLEAISERADLKAGVPRPSGSR
jgi:putative hydrolase of HD superfamily